jgi:hypothetical protein
VIQDPDIEIEGLDEVTPVKKLKGVSGTEIFSNFRGKEHIRNVSDPVLR